MLGVSCARVTWLVNGISRPDCIARASLALKDYLKHGQTEHHQGILPDKLAVYLVHPLTIKKDQLVRVA